MEFYEQLDRVEELEAWVKASPIHERSLKTWHAGRWRVARAWASRETVEKIERMTRSQKEEHAERVVKACLKDGSHRALNAHVARFAAPLKGTRMKYGHMEWILPRPRWMAADDRQREFLALLLRRVVQSSNLGAVLAADQACGGTLVDYLTPEGCFEALLRWIVQPGAELYLLYRDSFLNNAHDFWGWDSEAQWTVRLNRFAEEAGAALTPNPCSAESFAVLLNFDAHCEKTTRPLKSQPAGR